MTFWVYLNFPQRQPVQKLPFYYAQIYQNVDIKRRFFIFLSMQHIIGISHQQLRFTSLEDTISPDNQVRFIDALVEYVYRSKLDFAVESLKTESPLVILSQNFLLRRPRQ
ncbi:hypothetical protein ACNQGB_14960 [Flavobacterium sp. XS1P32]|uniref:hypothetical protein n=1 Tax=unclassified Flavobacterium TaxID=196869 RepID=UPI003AAD7DA1